MEFKGTRAAFAAALTELGRADSKVMFVSPDSLKAMRATSFADEMPDQYVEVGIAEQAAVDVGAGLASCGLTPFVATYAGFLTMRACEQMRTFVAYPNLNVKFAGINAGLIGGEREGVTHQFYEDIAILSSIPNFKIFLPADGPQTYHAVKLAYETLGPVYVRLGSGRENDVCDLSAPFSPEGLTIWRSDSPEIVLFSCGFVLDRVLAAAELLKCRGIAVTVADVNIIDTAADNPALIHLLQNARHVFTVEDANVNGGLGAYVSRLACEYAPVRVSRIGLRSFGESGLAQDVADLYGFAPEKITETVLSTLQ
jgi:transketolase